MLILTALLSVVSYVAVYMAQPITANCFLSCLLIIVRMHHFLYGYWQILPCIWFMKIKTTCLNGESRAERAVLHSVVVKDVCAVVAADNGLVMFMWIGLAASSDWVQNVLGVASVAQVDIDKV